MALIKKSTNSKCWRGCREKGTLLPWWWECKLVKPLWRTMWRFLKELEIKLPYKPAIPLLGIHTEETTIERDRCTPIFIAALFTIARSWKQPRCPSVDKWIRKLWYIYTMEYSIQFSHSVMSDSLRSHELQQARSPCPSSIPRVHPNSCPLSWWCYPTISFFFIPFSSHHQSFQASRSFHITQFFASGGQGIGGSAPTSVIPMNTQD